MTHTAVPQISARKYFVGALYDAFAPVVTYFVLHALGVPGLVCLVFGIVAAVGTTAVQTVKQRKLDKFGVLVIVETTIAIVLQFTLKDPRLLLIKPSFYSLAGAVYLAWTAFGDRPLTYDGARPMATQGDPVRMEAYERAWQRSAPFRSLHRVATLGWSLAFLADAVLRVVVVYTVPMGRALWLSNVPHIAAIVLLVGFSAMIGRRAKPIVDAQVEEMGEPRVETSV